MGFRKYYYAGQTDADVKEKEYIHIGFVTGCALFFPPELLDGEGRLLTERFFFGEEDFEFSMRMDAQGIKMACLLDSVIYHKVGASSSRMSGLGKIYLHYLNRFIDIRLHKSSLFYMLWALVNIPFCFRYFYKASRSVSASVKLLRRLLADAGKKQGVSRDDFEALVINNSYFD
jgi:GT2 family glycosyltransferase